MIGSWQAKHREKVRHQSRNGSPPANAPEPSEQVHAQVFEAANEAHAPHDSDESIFLARRVGYPTDNWEAGSRILKRYIGEHVALTRQFFQETFGKL